MLVYLVSNPSRHNFYEHFTWQAAAWLEGQAGIRYPVCPADGEPTFAGHGLRVGRRRATSRTTTSILDVLPVTTADGAPTGRALIPFPPLPALVLVPFVALWGLTTDAQTLAASSAAWTCGWSGGCSAPSARAWPSARRRPVFFGLGTVFWYTSMLGTTWYFAHVVAVGLTVLAVAIALRADRRAVKEAVVAMDADPGLPGAGAGRTAASTGRRRPSVDVRFPRRRVRAERSCGTGRGRSSIAASSSAGLLLGLACTARLTVVFGLPFLAFVGGGGTPLRRVLSAGLGAALPLLVLVAYNVATTGHIFHPAYEYLYQQEALGYPELGYNPAWSIEDLRYVPAEPVPDARRRARRHARLPRRRPAQPLQRDARSSFRKAVGMSLLLASPAYLLAIPALLRIRRSRIVAGGAHRRRRHRLREPHALQPGLGAVRLPLLKRLRAVRPAVDRARDDAAGPGAGHRRRARRRLDRRERMGRRLGRHPPVVDGSGGMRPASARSERAR